MKNRRLERLRHARVVCNKTIAKLESQLAYQRSRRDVIEAEIQAIAPDLQLPASRRKLNTLVARGELPRMALTVLREAGVLLAESVNARRVLQANGIDLPLIWQQRMTRARFRVFFCMAGRYRHRSAHCCPS